MKTRYPITTISFTIAWGLWIVLHVAGVFKYDFTSILFPIVSGITLAFALDLERKIK